MTMTDSLAFQTRSAAAAAPDWQMVTAPRLTAKALRFKGYRCAHHAEGPLFVSLWMRKAGGFVVGYSAWVDGDLQPDSRQIADLDQAAAWLEDGCPQPWQKDVIGYDGGLPLDGVLRGLHYQHAFPLLVGRALAEWAGPMLPPRTR